MFSGKNRFIDEHSFVSRINEAKRVLIKYPDRVPVICFRNSNAQPDCPDIDKNKYLVPRDLTLGQFLYTIRKRLRISSDKALYFFINDSMPSVSQYMNTLYEIHKNDDLFLYISFSSEAVFGF
jgi:GABA(A) receptor-associated protein